MTTSTATYTMPGEYARWLAHNRLTPGRTYAIGVPCWIVVNDQVRKVEVIRLRGADVECIGHDYADCKDGSRVATFYLFPVARHCKPRLETIHDQYGACRQWVAPLKARCVRPFGD